MGYSVLHLQEEDLLKIKDMVCDDPNIRSLDGIQYLWNLESLDLGAKGTGVDNITLLENLTMLERIYIPASKIDNITALSGLDLKYLDLTGNRVTDLTPLQEMANLEVLLLDRQHPDYITDIAPLKNLQKLRVLDLSHNKIADISALEFLDNITFLKLKDNRVASIEALSGMKLEILDISINQVSDLSYLDGSKQTLAYLNLAYNKLSSLDFLADFDKIRHLNAARNRINDITVLSSLNGLSVLILDINLLTDITPVYGRAGAGLINELSVSFNCIPEIDPVFEQKVVKFRSNGQCKPAPLFTDIDLNLVVNKDLITEREPANDPAEDGSDNDSGDKEKDKNEKIDQGVAADFEKGTSPGGCSFSGNGFHGADAVALCAAAFILIRKLRIKQGVTEE
ncbi:hypothetical protein AAG570_014050 [Ranatra chinensis]|uniref:Leucine-rich repeat domain-containing protein n=1 Tax=Ranatra chinensis TaxID=642074 RepID=A0ABD0XUB7_9HEMI